MEGIAPPLACVIEVQSAIRNGESVRIGVTKYVQNASTRDDFASTLRSFLIAIESGTCWRHLLPRLGPQRRALLEVLACGFAGQSISSQLDSLRMEIERACEAELRQHLEMLPLKMLMPLLMLQFPAFLLLMFGPLLRHLIEEINR